MAETISINDASLADKLESLTLQLKEATASIRSNSAVVDTSDKSIAQLAEAAKALVLATRQPTDMVMELTAIMAEFTTMRLFVKWKVFENIPKDGEITYSALAAKVGAEPALISRFAGILVAKGVLNQIGLDSVAHTKGSLIFASENIMTSMVQIGFDDHLRSLGSMPEYFDKYGLKEPAGRYKTIYAFAAGDPDQTVWAHMMKDPVRMADFMTMMVAMSQKMGMTGSYDFSWLLPEVSKSKDRVLVVDVGGGKGHAIKAICQATPGLPVSRCVVEDLAEVIDEAKATADAEMKDAQYVALDFHKEQPIKGASLYYIRRCLHDYGDEDSVEILQRIRDAMATDSRLLIVEQILSNPPSAIGASHDLIMASLGGKERSLEIFESIASRAGLKISQVCRPGVSESDVSIIECVPV